MDVTKVLHMKGGIGHSSYHTNSLLQKRVITITKPITEEAILDLYSTRLPKKLAIAELGCSSGPNTLFVVSVLIDAINKKCRQLERPCPEFQVFLNDLPENDFNTIFRSLAHFCGKLKEEKGDDLGQCFISGTPGSFYGRLFLRESIHFVHSSYSLQWLSQVPQGLESSNKGNIFISKSSPPCVLKAYYEQFESDFSEFLRLRSEELILGGRMVLTILGRRSADPSSRECCYIWELLALALGDMVSEGWIEEEKVDSFNLPLYSPSLEEVKSVILKQESFGINRLEISEVNWSTEEDLNSGMSEEGFSFDKQSIGHNVAKYMRAVSESLIASHFGDSIIEELF
ncbi:S-adenosyl-L-methionine:benzoic acid/salicylic acid carboxyl methyltransferase 3-like [Macadamia integrifolia]|uniref:S-adenosyl-L-methionine:benzoic acid/salicylic acid carboxyl methyltransferase 3-like n=1 Tax=Macadamia integrifolia TaxID=60698 RepID=UPI001C4F49FA|nr:S-adenosyl-L-methionine:benzoic acid/salicylic acid carboxyl methyltransferase 3-like [Macadamia integrifolia]